MQIIPLSESNCFDYVSVTGEEARSFLQGQITCNMELLAQDRSLHGALCNLKGRVIADFQLFLLSEDQILLQTEIGVGQKIVDTLSRYAVFSKVELALTAGPEAVFGIIGEATALVSNGLVAELPGTEYAVISSADFLIVRMSGPVTRFQLWCRTAAAKAKLNRLDLPEAQTSHSPWQMADIQAGIVHVNPKNSENYTPQLLNYDVSGVVDFEKGCYTGQEVVARMHYRAKAKKRLYRLVTGGSLEQDSNICLKEQPGKAVAEILSVAAHGNSDEGSEALAILNTELVASQAELRMMDGQESSVQIASLPYLAD